MRKGAVIAWLVFLFLAIGGMFWHSAWVYSLPTPVPPGYQAVNPGTLVNLPVEMIRQKEKKPLFLHFFNPDCPCSRFNMPHFRSLVRQYHQQVDFVLVLMTDKVYLPAELLRRFDLPDQLTVLSDTSLAKTCGVYSTPQAVIVDTAEKLYYRGNYNRNRYCTDDKSNFARMALESLLHNDPKQISDPAALKAYGCQLPSCTR